MTRRPGITLGTGGLIALERRAQRMWTILHTATKDRVRVTVPVAVVIEWWRGRTDVRERILGGVRVEPLHAALAKAAGEALATVKVSPIDAVVMASAAQRGDVVYTSDVEDLQRLRVHFPGVRVLAI